MALAEEIARNDPEPRRPCAASSTVIRDEQDLEGAIAWRDARFRTP